MIQRLLIAGSIALALSASAFANDAKTGPKAQGAIPGNATPEAIAQCEKLSGMQKSDCLQQAQQAVDRAATGATGASAGGRAGASSSMSSPKDAAPSSGSPKAY